VTGLTFNAGDDDFQGNAVIDQARQAWQESMTRRLDTLRSELRERSPEEAAACAGGTYTDGCLHLTYWGNPVAVSWSDLEAQFSSDGTPCSTFDTAMLLYYLRSADGAPMADRWIGFRELPNGAFYHQAFQGYSGNQIANAYGEDPDAFERAARALQGWPLPALAPHAYAFEPLPRIRLAAVLWPGDEEFPARASILFDAAASHYINTDCLALLGSGLARRLIKAGARA
jgi:hypothetical protein